MSFTDPIGDMIARIRNAQMRTSNNVAIPNSKFRVKILEILKQEGYISDYKIISGSTNKDTLLVDLKYYNGLFIGLYDYISTKLENPTFL